MTDPARPRPLNETVVLVLTIAVGFCLLAGVLGVVVMRVVHPEMDVGAPASSLGTLLSVLAGYIVGAYRSTRSNGGHG